MRIDLEDPYVSLGLGLMVFGSGFGLYSHFVLMDTTFTAIGMSCVILGSVFLLTPANPVPLDAVLALMDGAYVNIEALLEELDLTRKAVYFPRGDGVYCFIPRREEYDLGRVMDGPLRVLYEDGVVVFPPGSELIGLAGLGEEAGVEDALTAVLVDYLEACTGVRSVETGDTVVVKILDPVPGGDYPRMKLCMGSLTVNVAGSVLASVFDSPVGFLDESIDPQGATARFRVIDRG